jgi:hydrogenase maturation protein HypF
MTARNATEIRITGTVQGVGFRPTVWRLACEEGLVGEVLNDSAGVLIRAAGDIEAISRLVRRLQDETPPLSRIETVQVTPLSTPLDFSTFRISESVPGENHTRVAPDAAVCAACREEVLCPTGRRSGYPFANCTHCGPRFTIVRRVPYDRAHTTMAAFPMCEACAAEYASPADRRFHAQPIACPACGPRVWLERPADGIFSSPDGAAGSPKPRAPAEPTRLAEGPAAIAAALECLRSGQIVALRGLGGFHLACDATSAAAVERLRSRKHRYGKPFALMARDLEMVSRHGELTALSRRLLESPEAPIVLLPARAKAALPDGLAPGMGELGFMLPYTPLHVLIMRELDRPLVMTSGNVSQEPQVTDNDEARSKLATIADAMLLHDRDIANRIDDSVVRIVLGRPRLLRRARGHAPGAISLPAGFQGAPDLLAYGGELKSTFCLVKDGAAILSQHQGDLEDLTTFEDYQKNLQLYTDMYHHVPDLLAADLHPEYLSTKLAVESAAASGLELVQIQHHHAHVASCMVENGVPLGAPPVLGVILDGLGFGDDGTFWGGEILLADYCSYRRVGALKAVAMPGGMQAIRQPWRSLYAHLVAAVGPAAFTDQLTGSELGRSLEGKPLAAIARMLERGLNVPLASSCGRLFDAVAAALGMRADHAEFEAQGAMELEACAARCPARDDLVETAYPFAITASDGVAFHQLDPAPMWGALGDDLARGTAPAVMAARFHKGLARGISALVQAVRTPAVTTVVLSGGCFQNAILLEDLTALFTAEGLTCLSHEKVPTNDGGLSLGQAAIAAARHLRRAGEASPSFLTMGPQAAPNPGLLRNPRQPDLS